MIQVNELVGRTIGEYRIERLLGQSQLGVAYCAQHQSQGYEATVTMFNLPAGMLLQEYEQLGARFASEGKALVQLTHPHILPIYAYGIQHNYVYLITAFAKEASLAQFLKRNVRFTPQQALPILKQIAEGLDYAHSHGIVHGMLSLSNVIVNNDLTARIAGFGLRTILDIHGNAQSVPLVTQHSHERNTFLLGNAEYIAPERLMGRQIDGRADIYALGVILFVLLSGTQPFKGAQPLDIALGRLQQPVPSLHAVCFEVSEAFDLVIGRALERDPAKRLQSAGEIILLLERVLKSQDSVWGAGKTLSGRLVTDSQTTLPPTINWFDEQVMPDGQWQVAPSLEKGLFLAQASRTESVPSSASSTLSVGSNPDSISGSDPFAWWATTSISRPKTSLTPGTFPWSTPVRKINTSSSARRLPGVRDRRKLVTLLVTGTAVAGVTITGISFAHLLQSTKQSASPTAQGNTGNTGSTTLGSTPTAEAGQGTPGTRGTATPKPSTPQPTATTGTRATPTVQPTAAKPTPKPTPPPGHTGTVIGSTSMATNSAKAFTNPADGHSSLLIRLANGNFVACERACTHEGVAVNYDPGSQQLICPAHNAIFNSSGGFAHVSGPGSGPLPTVGIRVNADGTITTG